MNAEQELLKIAKAFTKFQLDAVMVGNAAAAINGAPVTTLDIDFVVEQTPENYRKIMAIASHFHCKVYELKLDGTEKYMYRLQNQEGTFFLDILHEITGFEDLKNIRKNAATVNFAGYSLKIASLKDILHSKRIAARPKDLAVIPILELTQNEIEEKQKKQREETEGLSF